MKITQSLQKKLCPTLVTAPNVSCPAPATPQTVGTIPPPHTPLAPPPPTAQSPKLHAVHTPTSVIKLSPVPIIAPAQPPAQPPAQQATAPAQHPAPPVNTSSQPPARPLQLTPAPPQDALTIIHIHTQKEENVITVLTQKQSPQSPVPQGTVQLQLPVQPVKHSKKLTEPKLSLTPKTKTSQPAPRKPLQHKL